MHCVRDVGYYHLISHPNDSECLNPSFQFYISWRDLYPPEVRDDLRQGLLAKHKGDLELSERYLRRYAYELPLSN